MAINEYQFPITMLQKLSAMKLKIMDQSGQCAWLYGGSRGLEKWLGSERFAEFDALDRQEKMWAGGVNEQCFPLSLYAWLKCP